MIVNNVVLFAIAFVQEIGGVGVNGKGVAMEPSEQLVIKRVLGGGTTGQPSCSRADSQG